MGDAVKKQQLLNLDPKNQNQSATPHSPHSRVDLDLIEEQSSEEYGSQESPAG